MRTFIAAICKYLKSLLCKQTIDLMVQHDPHTINFILYIKQYLLNYICKQKIYTYIRPCRLKVYIMQPVNKTCTHVYLHLHRLSEL